MIDEAIWCVKCSFAENPNRKNALTQELLLKTYDKDKSSISCDNKDDVKESQAILLKCLFDYRKSYFSYKSCHRMEDAFNVKGIYFRFTTMSCFHLIC